MAVSRSRSESPTSAEQLKQSQRASVISRLIESIVLAVVALSPWSFNDGHPSAAAFTVLPVQVYTPSFLYFAVLAVLLLLLAAQILTGTRPNIKKCPIALCLAALFLIGTWQLIPWPRGLLQQISPATAGLYAELLPNEREVLDDGPEPEHQRGRTISFDPGVTRAALYDWLAVLLGFVVVRHTFASNASLGRLCLVASLNGGLLALVALMNYLRARVGHSGQESASLEMLKVFINRNHAAYYLNLCIGLGFGLILELVNSRQRSRKDVSLHERTVPSSRGQPWGTAVPTEAALTSHPIGALLGAGALVALMVTALLLTQSRGGLAALCGGVFLAIVVTRSHGDRWRGVQTVALLATAVLGLAVWLGFTWSKSHYSTLQEDRLAIWKNSWQVIPDFWRWGTGYGTFRFVEPLRRTVPLEPGRFEPHALNEYVEALVEGGWLRFLLTVVLVGTIVYQGYRAFKLHQGHRGDGLIVGALAAFFAATLHSFVESGVHSPPTAALLVVIVAHLSAASQPSHQSDRTSAGKAKVSPVGSSTAKWVWVTGLASLAVLFFARGWHDHVLAPVLFRSISGLPSPMVSPRRAAALEQASRSNPDDAWLVLNSAWMHEVLYEVENERLREHADAMRGVQIWKAGVERMLPQASAFAVPLSCAYAAWVPEVTARAEGDALKNRHLVPALRAYLKARDLSPLLGRAQMGIAAHTDLLENGDSPANYMARAQLTRPTDPEIWYRCGSIDYLRHNYDSAWRSWRRTLELSDRYLREVIDLSRKVLSGAELADRLLPNDPPLLLEAVRTLDPEMKNTTEYRPIAEKALRLLDENQFPENADWWHYRAMSYGYLGMEVAARQAYEEALRRKPLEVQWRYEFATLLYHQGLMEEARREFLTVMSIQPTYKDAQRYNVAAAKRLFETVQLSSFFAETKRDFGMVPRGTQLEHQFRWSNRTEQALRLANVRTSCGCTTATADRLDWPPGSSGSITVALDTSKFTGAKAYSVYLDFDRPKRQEGELTVRAVSREDLVVEPVTIELDPTQDAPVTIRIEHAGPAAWEITGVDNDLDWLKVAVKKVRADASGVAYELTAQRTREAGSTNSELWIKTNDASAPRFRIPVVVASSTAITVSPAALNMGAMSSGTPESRRVIVRAAKPFSIRSIDGSDALIRVEFDAGQKSIHMLTVKVTPQAASGRVDRRLTIHTDRDRDAVASFSCSFEVSQQKK